MSDPQDDISSWPARLGAGPGDTILLMADLTRMAWRMRRSGAPFHAGRLLDAFLDAVSPGGLVLVPTFTHHLGDGAAFDVRNTPSISGALAGAALAHPRFLRTGHPLHSFAVAGNGAGALASTEHEGSFDADSPFAHLLRSKARLIAFDLPPDDAFTFVHHAEALAHVPYRRYRRMHFRHTDREGRTRDRIYSIMAKRRGHINAFGRLVPLLERAGALQERSLDGARVLLVDIAAAHAVVLSDIRDNGARAIHHFSMERWGRDTIKAMLRTLGIHRRT